MAINSFVLDTSAYLSFFRGSHPELKPYFIAQHQLLLPIIVIGELRAGFAAGTKASFNEQNLQRFLASPNVDVLTITDRTTLLYAQLFARLKAAGTPIGTNDLWIAALALEHDLPLLTLDTDFTVIPNLMLALS